MRLRHLLPAVGLVLATASTAQAQFRGVSLWLGAGRPWGDTSSVQLKNSDIYAGLQMDIPLIPVALRAEGMASYSNFKSAPRTYIASAVLPLRLPGVQPYAIAGYGAYGYNKPTEVRGYSYGGGVRFGVGRTGFFGEVRRHEKLNKSQATFGITL